jgi:hypothetical protein
MPAKSVAQRNLFAAAEHGATFAKAVELRNSMSQAKLHEFATGAQHDLPAHVPKHEVSHPGRYMRSKKG